jgi:hypothetical protein
MTDVLTPLDNKQSKAGTEATAMTAARKGAVSLIDHGKAQFYQVVGVLRDDL